MTEIVWRNTELMPFIELSDGDQQKLLSLARESIQVRLLFERDLQIDEAAFNPALRQQASSFVTLRKKDKLRGCIGELDVSQPLVMDVVDHAAASAFEDPHFPAVTREEVAELRIEVSVLTEPTSLSFSSEADLLSQLKPDEDGPIIEMSRHCARFLPTV
ncbi:MAG: AmmeMemoRadiSam system protein A [Porticoccus sp.]